MSSNSYDASQNTLSPIAGTPKSQLNEAIAKAEASLKNQAKHIEAGNVATVAHSAGDFIIYGSSKQFAKVTQTIAIGSSIADGVNVDNITEGEILSQLNVNSQMEDISNAFKAMLTANGISYSTVIARKCIIHSICYVQFYVSGLSKSGVNNYAIANIFDIIPSMSSLYGVSGVAACTHNVKNSTGGFLDSTGVVFTPSTAGAAISGSFTFSYCI